MLLPHEWCILTLEDAKLLLNHLETSTARKGLTVDYKKLAELGLLKIHAQLRGFLKYHQQFETELLSFRQGDFVKDTRYD